ncbi:chromate transporter [Thermosporothrix hazakensis]|jgi:chromate transporter|uniref:Chromate transporter n=2 Tax=Thermosporothrix TaxID=768650 RepID=A0A326U244_THEHA|nr:chromate transporter [Thermosporothrix hazakensis]PZW24684.1 chromate transporter [Thermosporothrix hazakensis]BBH90334.1 hypothetical protein KTC_50850 [Thermosporothrix sp. COM3]GCE48370.1 hypothetical protein KTH_32390 [Thermosporothrix hazakensis]
MRTLEPRTRISPTTKPTLWQLLWIWGLIGLQSFGGGASTQLLVQRTFIEKYQWMTMDEFLRFWGMCVTVPGINLIALTILIGRKLGGLGGIVVSLIGMLFPSALITCLLAIGYASIEHLPAMRSIQSGLVPATGGMMLMIGLRFAKLPLQQASKEGIRQMILSILLIALCMIAVAFFHLSVMIVFLGAALLGIVLFTPRTSKEAKEEQQARDESQKEME